MKNLPTPLIAVAIFTVLFLLERFFPLRKTTRSLIVRLLVNLVIAVLTFIVAVGLVQPAARCALGVDPTVVSPAAILQQEHSFLIPNTEA
jgi:hypothetical protein